MVNRTRALRSNHTHPRVADEARALAFPFFGPLVCDVYVNSTPRVVAAVIQLKRHMTVPVHDGSDPARFISSDAPTLFSAPNERRVEELLSKDTVAADLTHLLTCDASRAETLMLRGRVQRAEHRLRIRTDVAVGARRAAGLHVRVSFKAVASREGRPQHSMPRRGLQWTPHVLPARKEFTHSRNAPRGPVSQWPRFSRERRARAPQKELVRMALGAALLCSVVAGLASAGTLVGVGRDVRAIAHGGTLSLLSGVRALLTADAQGGSARFTEAGMIFERARRQLGDSTSILQRLAGSLDPRGRLPAARALLRLGERAAVVGAEATSLLRVFQGDGLTLTETLESVEPRLRTIHTGLGDIAHELNGISTVGLPAADAAQARTLTASLNTLHEGLSLFLQSEAVVLELLGSRQDRQYLVLFENNRELRPTGGFIGSLALVDVSRGEVRNVSVNSIYDPDGQMKDYIIPPVPLQKITDRWYARDANWFADFRQSATKVATFFERSGGPTVDGVIAVTPTVLEELLRLTGPISMPAYAVTVTAENVVNETQRLVTFAYDRQRNQPKAFLKDLLPEVLARVAALPRQQWGALLDVLTSALDRKHLLVYFRDSVAEEAVVRLGWGGALPVLRVPTATSFQDHVGRVEANVGGHKTDILIEQESAYDVTVGADGAFEATLVVTRHHRGSRSGTHGIDPAEDPSRKANIVYERTFVPSGSTLVDARGFTDAASVPASSVSTADYRTFTQDEELRALEESGKLDHGLITVARESGFTTFGGWVLTNPEETTVTVLRYRLPFRTPHPAVLSAILHYELLLTQQPGHLPVLTKVTVRLPEAFRFAWAAPTSVVSFAGERKAAFVASLDRDALWGAILEER